MCVCVIVLNIYKFYRILYNSNIKYLIRICHLSSIYIPSPNGGSLSHWGVPSRHHGCFNLKSWSNAVEGLG